MYRRHVLSNAALPALSIIGLPVGALLGGAVVAEAVFGYPGLGKLLVVIAQGAALVIATASVVVDVLTELSSALLDPGLRAR